MDLTDATVVVTGGTRGLGRAVAAAAADAGAHVVVCSRDGEAVESTVEALTAAGGDASGMRADVRDEYDVERLLEHAARRGGVDVVVANAGVAHATPGEMPVDEESYAAFDDTMRTNVRGVFATVREALPHLSDDGRVLVPSGSVAREAKEGMGAYAVSKAAAEALVRQVHADTDADAFVVDPGLVATELTGAERARDPEEVADMFLWAATAADPAEHGGGVVDLRTWKTATR